jgi:hypothetical protein
MSKHVDIVFDGPPGHESGRFVEVEDHTGRSISFGRWLQRDDGFWVLRIVPHESDLPHYHVAGTTAGKDIDECARCGQDLRNDIHRVNHDRR